MAQYLMQAVSSGVGGDGALKSWPSASLDWAAAGFPGPGTAAHVAVSAVVGEDLSGSVGDNEITFAKLQNIGVGLIGNDSGTADPKLITLGAGLAFAAGALTVAAGAVTLAMMANLSAARIIGSVAGGVPAALTGTQATTLLDNFTSTTKGLAPLSGGGTTNFLRADGAWAAPAGAGGTPGGSSGQLQWNSTAAFAGTANITTNGTRIDFATSSTNALLNFAHNTTLLGAKTSGGTDITLVSWGVGASNRLTLGSATGITGLFCNIASGSYAWQFNSVTALLATPTSLSYGAVASTGTVAPTLLIVGADHTSLTLSTERHSVFFSLANTLTWATGALTQQRVIRVHAPTLAFAGASTVGMAATLAISGAPVVGANATITNRVAIWLENDAIGFGADPARSGLLRTESNVEFWRGRFSSTDLQLLKLDSSGQLIVGDANVVGEYHQIKTAGTYQWKINTTSYAELTSAAFDFKNTPLTNVASLTGTFFGNEIDDGNSGTSKAIDFSAGQTHKLTLTGNCTLTFTAPTQHKYCRLKFIQGSGGPWTVTYPASVKPTGNINPSLTTVVGDADIVTLDYDGTRYHLSLGWSGTP